MVVFRNGKERYMSTFTAKICACMCAPLACALLLSSAAIVSMVGVFVVVVVLAVVGIIIRSNALPGRAG